MPFTPTLDPIDFIDIPYPSKPTPPPFQDGDVIRFKQHNCVQATGWFFLKNPPSTQVTPARPYVEQMKSELFVASHVEKYTTASGYRVVIDGNSNLALEYPDNNTFDCVWFEKVEPDPDILEEF